MAVVVTRAGCSADRGIGDPRLKTTGPEFDLVAADRGTTSYRREAGRPAQDSLKRPQDSILEAWNPPRDSILEAPGSPLDSVLATHVHDEVRDPLSLLRNKSGMQ